MRGITAVGIILGCIIGVQGTYLLMSPFIEATRLRTSVLKYDTTSFVILRGSLESIDTVGKTLTVRVSFPGSPKQTAPFRIPFDAVQNFSNLDLHVGPLGSDAARTGGDDIKTAQIGQLVSMRLLRNAGPFIVLSLTTMAPLSKHL